MLPAFYTDYDRLYTPTLEKRLCFAGKSEDATQRGAFPLGSRLTLTICIPRQLGMTDVALRLWRDGGEKHDRLFSVATVGAADSFVLSLDTRALCAGKESGIFYYHLLFRRGGELFYSYTRNQVDFSLSVSPEAPFRLLVYAPDFRTPAWFVGGTVYHIFVDRFCRGRGNVTYPVGVLPETDWNAPVRPYAIDETVGAPSYQFFGGNLWGVEEKLDYLADLGVTVLYLSPVFEATSNHKYDTGNYEAVDGGYGGEAALEKLLRSAAGRGIRVILDGVFNHTGSDSRYFNRYGRYPSSGAYQSTESPYADWFTFRSFPDDYECWWNVPSLPRLRSDTAPVEAYLAGKDGIAARRTKAGISGWRLDVADELSEHFLETLRESLHAASTEQPLLLGEVWENAADKVAYGRRRHYLSGRQLDSVMNYPLRTSLIAFLRDRDAEALYDTLTELYASYPLCVCNCLYNLLGSHDTPRILTLLGHTREESGALTPVEREKGGRLLGMAFTLLYTVYGVPAVFYGDEAGVEGGGDPYCRRSYPWGAENGALRSFVRTLGQLRRTHPALWEGSFRILAHEKAAIAFERACSDDRLVVIANRSDAPFSLSLPGQWRCLLPCENAALLSAPPDTATVWEFEG